MASRFGDPTELRNCVLDGTNLADAICRTLPPLTARQARECLPIAIVLNDSLR